MGAFRYSISPAIATVNAALIMSFLIRVVAPSQYVFATLSNLCFVAAGLYSEIVGARRGAIFGKLSDGSLLLVLMGASSFAFHRDPALGEPEHTLDIYFGWIIVSHAAYVTLTVSVIGATRYLFKRELTQRATTAVHIVLSIGYMTFLCLVTTFYGTVYSNQLQYYFTVGPVAAVLGGCCRFLLVFEEDGKCSLKAVGIAVFEMVVLLTALGSAIVTQSQLLGRKLGGQDAEYDLYHGLWHYQLAIVLCILYARASTVERMFVDREYKCICELPYIDIAGLAILLVFSTCATLFKEMKVDFATSDVILGGISCVMLVHSIAMGIQMFFFPIFSPFLEYVGLKPLSVGSRANDYSSKMINKRISFPL